MNGDKKHNNIKWIPNGECLSNCDRQVVPDENGIPMVVCFYCKRIVIKRNPKNFKRNE
jgi:hypothetical protein